MCEVFEYLWSKYPKKLGKKAAEKHFRASVKNQADFGRVEKALNNYLENLRVNDVDHQFVMHGSTFFYNWEDWETYEPPKTAKRTEVEVKKTDDYLASLGFGKDEQQPI